jgi:hypothetical protein
MLLVVDGSRYLQNRWRAVASHETSLEIFHCNQDCVCLCSSVGALHSSGRMINQLGRQQLSRLRESAPNAWRNSLREFCPPELPIDRAGRLQTTARETCDRTL